MNIFVVILILFIIVISFFNCLIYRRKRDNYFKAGKKWDEIVKELSKRK